MPDPFDLMTSVTLLGKLCDPQDPQNGEAWRRFLDRYQPLIHAHCRRLVPNRADAEDMTGDVLVKLARKMKDYRYDSERSFRGWLHTVVRHTIIDWWRRRRHEPHVLGVGAVEAWERLPHRADETDRLAEQLSPLLGRDLGLMRQAMALVRERIKPQRWRAFEETVLNDRAAPAVARDLGLKVGDVYVAKTQIAAMLRKQIAAMRGLAGCDAGV
jgi:RNA polymerase sigma-70 factor (ECF subfamily)